jgi:hypothetical protein
MVEDREHRPKNADLWCRSTLIAAETKSIPTGTINANATK